MHGLLKDKKRYHKFKKFEAKIPGRKLNKV